MNSESIQWFIEQPLWFTIPIAVAYVVLWLLFFYIIWRIHRDAH